MKDYRYDMHYLRAIAICFIVIGHTFNYGWPEGIGYGIIRTFFDGGTAIFVFISGYFFSFLIKGEFSYGKYLKKKMRNIICPYLILSTSFFLFFSYRSGLFFANSVSCIAKEYFYQILLGQVFPSYWYIPFAVLLFVSSPVFFYYRRIRVSLQVLILAISFLPPLFIHRSIENLNIIQSYLYFTPYYLMGVFFDTNYGRLESKIYNFPFFLLYTIASLAITACQVILVKHTGNYYKAMMEYNGFDLNVPAKFFLILSLLYLTKKLTGRDHIVLKTIGSTSFSIYFFHLYFIYFFSEQIGSYTGFFYQDTKILLLYVLSSVGFSVLCARIAKWIFGPNSRMIVGY